jgi:hypothetical protein
LSSSAQPIGKGATVDGVDDDERRVRRRRVYHPRLQLVERLVCTFLASRCVAYTAMRSIERKFRRAPLALLGMKVTWRFNASRNDIAFGLMLARWMRIE